jgi:hypothetical protein
MSVEEYFKVKPMLTPAVAGMATMTVTATLVSQFYLTPSLTALFTAFVFGLLAWSDRSVPLLQRAILYVVHSITIFSIAVGINETAVGMTKSPAQLQYEQRLIVPEGEARPFLRSWF